MSQDPDPIYSFTLEPDRVVRRKDGSFWGNWLEKQGAEALPVREKLFRVKTPEQGLAFFQKYGPYQVDEFWGRQAGEVSFSELMARRRFYEDALVDRSSWDTSLKDKNAELSWWRCAKTSRPRSFSSSGYSLPL